MDKGTNDKVNSNETLTEPSISIPDTTLRYRKWKHLSPSSSSTCARCLRRGFFKCNLGLQPRDMFTTALDFGSSMHNGIPHSQRIVGPKEISKRIPNVDKSMEHFNKLWDDSKADPKRGRTKGQAKSLFQNFIVSHKNPMYQIVEPPDSTIKFLDSKGVPELISSDEVCIAMDVGIEVPIVMKLDGVGQDNEGNLWAIEYKTTSEFSTRFFSGFGLAPQTLTYTLGLLQATGESNIVKGTIYEFFQVAKTSAQVFTLPVAVSTKSLEEIVEWYQELWNRILLAELSFLSNGIIPFPNLAACSSYPSYGSPGFLCEYQPLCLNIKRWKELAEGMYDVSDERQVQILKGT